MNTPENWKTFATIRVDSERAAAWREVFGGDRVPVKSILPGRANLPGKMNALVYEMDIAALTPDQRSRLVASIASRFEQDPAFVEANLDREGCPVLADDVTVSATNVGLLMPDFLLDDDDLITLEDDDDWNDNWDEWEENDE